MLVQMSDADVAADDACPLEPSSAMPAAGQGRLPRKVSARAVWGGIIIGASLLALTIINLEAPKSVNRQTVGLYALLIAVVLATIFLALVAVRARMRAHLTTDTIWTTRPGCLVHVSPCARMASMRLVSALFIAFALFRSVPTAIDQTLMVTSGGVQLYSTLPMVLAIIGYALA